MFEGTVDIAYILDGPLKRKQLEELAVVEMAEDRYKELAFEAKRRGLTTDQLLRKAPQFRFVEEEYKSAVKHKACQKKPDGVPRSSWPIRWSRIPRQEKAKYLDLARAGGLLAFTITHLGDSAAHSRFSLLKDFVDHDNNGRFRVRNRPRSSYLYAGDWTALEATVCLLLASILVVKHFYLDSDFDRKLERLFIRLKNAAKPKRVLRLA